MLKVSRYYGNTASGVHSYKLVVAWKTPWNPKAQAHLKQPSIGKGTTTMGTAKWGLAAQDHTWSLNPPSLHRVHKSEFNLFLTSISQDGNSWETLCFYMAHMTFCSKIMHTCESCANPNPKIFPLVLNSNLIICHPFVHIYWLAHDQNQIFDLPINVSKKEE